MLLARRRTRTTGDAAPVGTDRRPRPRRNHFAEPVVPAEHASGLGEDASHGIVYTAAAYEQGRPQRAHPLGLAFNGLSADSVHAPVLMQAFVAGADPAIGEVARAAMSEIYSLIAERTGCTPDQARDCIAHGMLINVLLAIDAPAHHADHPGPAELTRCTVDAEARANGPG